MVSEVLHFAEGGPYPTHPWTENTVTNESHGHLSMAYASCTTLERWTFFFDWPSLEIFVGNACIDSVGVDVMCNASWSGNVSDWFGVGVLCRVGWTFMFMLAFG